MVRTPTKSISICKALCVLQLCIILFSNCQNSSRVAPFTYNYSAPIYNPIQLSSIDDSLNYVLDDNTYTEIKSFNYFVHKNTEYISFYDRRSESVNIYNFRTQTLLKKLKLKKYFTWEPLYKTSVYVINLDSIYITNQKSLYLFNSTGRGKKIVDFFDSGDAMAVFAHTTPALFTVSSIYMGIRPSGTDNSISTLKKWRAIYQFDMQHKHKTLYYALPDTYFKNQYEYAYRIYSYCLNDRGRFVFSFPADTNIYETNLSNYHAAFYGKSRFQTTGINSGSNPVALNESGRPHPLQDAYGSIFFDPYKKRYLRLAKSRTNRSDSSQAKTKRKQSVIVFNQELRIIGEYELKEGYAFDSIFFTRDGSIYARTNLQDEYALHFVRLAYQEDKLNDIQLTLNK
jgi:hypothetical protein